MNDISLENSDKNQNEGASTEAELNLDFDIPEIEADSLENDENDESNNYLEKGGSGNRGDKDSHRISQLRKAEKNLRAQNSELKAQNADLKIQLHNAHEQLGQYAELFKATYANGVPSNSINNQSQEGELSPDMSIEEKVVKIIEKREKQYNQNVLKAQHENEARSLKEELTESINKAMKKYPDYEDVVINNQSLPLSKSIVDTITFLPNQGEILYALAKNPKELERISKLPMTQQIKTLANHSVKIAARLSSSSLNAPAPIDKKLPSRSSGKSTVDYRNMSASEILKYKQSLRR